MLLVIYKQASKKEVKKMQLLAMCSRVYEWFSVYSYYEAIKREVLECKHAPKDILRFFFCKTFDLGHVCLPPSLVRLSILN